jgi:hypothetical protein
VGLPSESLSVSRVEPRTGESALDATGPRYRVDRQTAHRASRSTVSTDYTKRNGQMRSTRVSFAYAEKPEAGAVARHSRRRSLGDHSPEAERTETYTAETYTAETYTE